MHVHIDPDFVPRIIDDVGLARRCLELGLAGFQMKSHYTSTAERARTVNAAVPGVRAIGAIVLNQAVGGMNALAVEIAAREGARTVWMPTVNSVNEMEEVHSFAPGAPMPVWMKFEVSLREAGVEPEPVAVVDDDGELLPAVREVHRGRRAPPAGARDRPPRPRRDLRASSTPRSRPGSAMWSSRTPSSRRRI